HHHVVARGLELTDLEAYRDTAIHPRLGKIDAAVVVDLLYELEVVTVGIDDPLRHVPERKQRQHRLGHDLELGMRLELLRQLAAPRHVIADHGAQALQPVGAQQEPDLQGAKPPTEGYRPLGVVDDPVAAVCGQIFGLYRQRSHQILWCPDEVRRAVELRAEPFVRVEDDRVGLLDACPVVPEFRTDHRRTGPCGIDVEIEPVALRDFRHRSYLVGAAHAGAADRSDDARRHVAVADIAGNRGFEVLHVHRAQMAGDGNANEIGGTDARDPDGAVDRTEIGRASCRARGEIP